MTIKNIRTEHIRIANGQKHEYCTFLTKGERTKKVITVDLAGNDASIVWYLFVIGAGQEKFSFDVTIRHTGHRTKSRMYLRSVLSDSSALDVSAVSTVASGVHDADTFISFRSLLLSSHAKARAIPSLEILSHDVMAGHAASVERLSADSLFYLHSRGLDDASAEALVVNSFLLEDVVTHGTSEIKKIVEKKISHLPVLNLSSYEV